MRKLLTGLLTATALVPSLASAQQWQDPRYQQERRDNTRDYYHDQRDDHRDYVQDRQRDQRELQRGTVTPSQYARDRAQDNARYAAERSANYRDYRSDQRDARNDAYQRQWNRDWHNDNRYDWNRYRLSNRNAYHLPRYYGPSGWNRGYTRFSIGIRLASPLWGRSYWISNPWSYRLPPAYGPYQWVRYYNDALLIDTRTGVVVDTAYGIFW